MKKIETTLKLNNDFKLKIELQKERFTLMTLIKNESHERIFKIIDVNITTIDKFVDFVKSRITNNFFILKKINSNSYELILFDYSKCNSNPKTNYCFITSDNFPSDKYNESNLSLSNENMSQLQFNHDELRTNEFIKNIEILVRKFNDSMPKSKIEEEDDKNKIKHKSKNEFTSTSLNNIDNFN